MEGSEPLVSIVSLRGQVDFAITRPAKAQHDAVGTSGGIWHLQFSPSEFRAEECLVVCIDLCIRD